MICELCNGVVQRAQKCLITEFIYIKKFDLSKEYMEIEITILVVSKMLRKACVAGVNTEMEWFRPVRLPDYNLYLRDINPRTGQIQKGNVLIFEDIELLNNTPHSEDFIISSNTPITLIRTLDSAELTNIVSEANESDDILESNLNIKDYLINSNRSLCVIKPDNIIGHTYIDSYDNSYKPKIQFEFGDRNLNLSCQDIHWRALGRTESGREIQREILEEEDVHFIIGLSRLFNDDYWPLIVGIYPLPNIEIDYGNI